MSSVKQTVNSAGGFSITQYTGASGNQWILNGLGTSDAKVDFYIIKANAAQNWKIWHTGFADQTEDHLSWNLGNAVGSHSDIWAGTGPETNGKIHLGQTSVMSASTWFMCYAWKATAGVSAFGKYTGTGGALSTSDQSGATNCGFKPRWLMIKNRDVAARNWVVLDSFRSDPDSPITTYFNPSTTAAEADTAAYEVTFTSTGFTFSSATTINYMNTSSDTYIYAAFA